MSELSPIGTINSDYNMKSGSVGQLVPNTLGKILDENGRSLPPHTPGELALHGPQVMLGYLDEPDKTKECLSGSGWLRTGDVAHYDEDGFVGRLLLFEIVVADGLFQTRLRVSHTLAMHLFSFFIFPVLHYGSHEGVDQSAGLSSGPRRIGIFDFDA